MKKLLLLSACLVALASSPVLAQGGGPDVLVIRVYDNIGNGQLRLTISRSDGKSEVVDMPGGGESDKKLMESGQSFQRVFAKLYQEGYTIKSTFSGTEGSTTTLVLVKGQ